MLRAASTPLFLLVGVTLAWLGLESPLLPGFGLSQLACHSRGITPANSSVLHRDDIFAGCTRVLSSPTNSVVGRAGRVATLRDSNFYMGWRRLSHAHASRRPTPSRCCRQPRFRYPELPALDQGLKTTTDHFQRSLPVASGYLALTSGAEQPTTILGQGFSIGSTAATVLGLSAFGPNRKYSLDFRPYLFLNVLGGVALTVALAGLWNVAIRRQRLLAFALTNGAVIGAMEVITLSVLLQLQFDARHLASLIPFVALLPLAAIPNRGQRSPGASYQFIVSRSGQLVAPGSCCAQSTSGRM